MPTGSSDVPPSRSARGAGVDDDGPARGLGVLQPELEGRVAGVARGEARAGRLAVERRGQRAVAQPAADDRLDPARRRHLGGDDL